MIFWNRVRAVTFDVGGTLITPWPSVGHVYAEVAGRHGCPGLSPELLGTRFAAAWRSLERFEHRRAEWARLVDLTFQGLVELPPSQTFFPALYERFTEPDAWHVFEDVVPTLERLKTLGLKLGIISNWDERLRPLLRSLGLEPYFEEIVVSCEAGVSKPASRIFEVAARQVRSSPAAVLHVGDSQEMDVEGAQAAGMQAVLLKREGRGTESNVICSLAELRAQGRGCLT